MIQEIADEDGMLEYITVELDSTLESVGSGDSGAIVEPMETTGHKAKCHHMGGNSANVHLVHNFSSYDFFNFMII